MIAAIRKYQRFGSHALQGDFQVWVPLFNHFDEYFEQHTSKRHDLLLDWLTDEQDPPFPTATVLAVLRATATILVHCPNKHLYQSSEVSPDSALETPYRCSTGITAIR